MEKIKRDIYQGNTKAVIQQLSETVYRHINSIGKDGLTALHLAIELEAEEIINALLEIECLDMNVKDTKYNWTPLMHLINGAYGENDYILRMILNREDTCIDCTDSEGLTALHHASRLGRLSYAKVLLSKGASINKQNDKLETPLHLASLNGHIDMIYLLLPNADVNIKDFDGNTSLHLAVKSKLSNICKYILDTKCIYIDINRCSDCNGNTPLHLAASLGLKNIMGPLQDAGFLYSSTNFSGHTAKDLEDFLEDEKEKEIELKLRAKSEKKSRKRQNAAVDYYATEVSRFCIKYDLSGNTMMQLYQRQFRMLDDAMTMLDDRTLKRFGLSIKEREQFFRAKEAKEEDEEDERLRLLQECKKAEEAKSIFKIVPFIVFLGLTFLIFYTVLRMQPQVLFH